MYSTTSGPIECPAGLGRGCAAVPGAPLRARRPRLRSRAATGGSEPKSGDGFRMSELGFPQAGFAGEAR
jgi:hypothetical protein